MKPVRVVTAGLLVVGLLAGTAYAASAAGDRGSSNPSTRSGGAEQRDPIRCKKKVYFTFNKYNNGKKPLGTLELRKRTKYCNRETLGTWKAGAGSVRNSCVKNRGWLPNGTYPSKKAMGNSLKKIRYYPNMNSAIKGKAWYLGDHYCKNGTKRTELFIHTRKPWNGYVSNGCIKVKPGVADKIAELQRKHGKPTKLYVKS